MGIDIDKKYVNKRGIYCFCFFFTSLRLEQLVAINKQKIIKKSWKTLLSLNKNEYW